MTDFKAAMAGNYTVADRPNDIRIRYIVIHATELNYRATIARFQTPNQVSAHVVIRQRDGYRTTMVAPQNVAWHAGNWDMNCRSLGIEQEAYAEQPASFTQPMLHTLATQILEWSTQYHISLDRAHLLGHDNVAAPTQAAEPAMHRDPGWYFDWEALFRQLGIVTKPKLPVNVGHAVRITDTYADLFQQPISQSRFIGKRLEPLSHRVSYGQEFACVAKDGGWIAINFSGRLGWINENQVTGVQRPILKVAHQISLYGSTQPDAPAIDVLQPGEQYVISDEPAGLQTSDTSGRLTVQKTGDLFWQIWYGHRIGYVKKQ